MTESVLSREDISNGTVESIDGVDRIYYNGYWILYYPPPDDTLTARKNLISDLTRRTFHHTEAGINTPGENLDLARRHYEQERNPQEKRVYAAMLAGALFNRAADIITTAVDLESKGVHIGSDNDLMKECSECLQEAMEIGKLVRHKSGVEGIDELWGEPFKAFTLSLPDFYDSRYIKLSLSMRDMDRIATKLRIELSSFEVFKGVWSVLDRFVQYSKQNCETSKRDLRWYSIWPKVVTNSECLEAYIDAICGNPAYCNDNRIVDACELIISGRDLISYISDARVPMPDTTFGFFQKCDNFDQSC